MTFVFIFLLSLPFKLKKKKTKKETEALWPDEINQIDPPPDPPSTCQSSGLDSLLLIQDGMIWYCTGSKVRIWLQLGWGLVTHLQYCKFLTIGCSSHRLLQLIPHHHLIPLLTKTITHTTNNQPPSLNRLSFFLSLYPQIQDHSHPLAHTIHSGVNFGLE